MNREAESLFHELADLSPAQQQTYLQEHRVPPQVRAEVEALLRFDVGGDRALTASVAECAGALLDPKLELRRGRRCGPYRLGRLVGRGGMGSVYLAEREDGEVRQRVAIKLFRYDGDLPAFRERFLRERQILASLNHPGIARLLDAGHTDDGQPYLAMDYIEGTPIDVYAEKLDLRGELGVFLRGCDAVSYAHRNLVIHRDIKPSNILVDTSGDPKLLDFGIAKILDSTGDQTRTQERLMTPEYASPEQLLGRRKGPRATSIHSAPFCSNFSLAAPRVDWRTVNLRRRGNGSPLFRGVWISLSARLYEKSRRSAMGRLMRLRTTFRPFWNPGQSARDPAAPGIETRKSLRRYWGLAAASRLVIASLAAGLYIANRERAIAQRRFLEVRRLANKVLALDEVIRVLPGSTKARKEIVAMSQEYLEGQESEAPKDRELAFEVAGSYWALARAQGVPTTANLGQYAQADVSLKKADALLDPILKRAPENRKALLLAADVAQNRMILAGKDHRAEEGLS